MTEAVRAACEALVEALRGHAAVMDSTDVEPGIALPAINAVRSAALAYVEVTSDRSGWGNVFQDLYDDIEDRDEEDEDLDWQRPEQVALRVSIEGRWDFVVRDEDRFVAYVRRRFAEANPEVDRDHMLSGHTADAVACLSELFHMDAWRDAQYTEEGLDPAGSGYTATEVSRTLWEMSDAEREEAGF